MQITQEERHRTWHPQERDPVPGHTHLALTQDTFDHTMIVASFEGTAPSWKEQTLPSFYSARRARRATPSPPARLPALSPAATSHANLYACCLLCAWTYSGGPGVLYHHYHKHLLTPIGLTWASPWAGGGRCALGLRAMPRRAPASTW